MGDRERIERVDGERVSGGDIDPRVRHIHSIRAVGLALALALSSTSCRRPTTGIDASRSGSSLARPIDAGSAIDAALEPPPEMLRPPPNDAGRPATIIDAGPPLPHSLRRILEAIERGNVPLARVVDSARGVTAIAYLEATPGPRGHEHIASEQLCGSALAPGGRLQTDLASMVRQSRDFEEGLSCSETECHVPGMEWGVDYHVRFERRPGADPLLVAIWLTSEATMGEEWLARVHRYVRTHLDPTAVIRCDGGAAHARP